MGWQSECLITDNVLFDHSYQISLNKVYILNFVTRCTYVTDIGQETFPTLQQKIGSLWENQVRMPDPEQDLCHL